MDGRQSAEMDGREGYPYKGIHLRVSKRDISPSSDLFPQQVSIKIPSADELAESIYQEYPRKVKRPEALKAIKKALKTHPAEFLLEKVKAYSQAIGWQELRFIPHPATWFNNARWEDDPAEWEQPAPRPQTQTAVMDTSRRPSTIETIER
ncbi:MAG: hypothetical protein NTW21_43915 [Verrucomicrobia bacterium]|nr:hypothetical protein [Verrucomicrobiota bacterium]